MNRLAPPLRIDAAGDEGQSFAARTLPLAVTFVIAVAFAVLFSWLAVARHQAFQSHAFDLGNMDQAVWNTLHGHLLRFTDMQVGHRVFTSRLAIHVEPLLIPMALLYLIHSGPSTLLITQAVVVCSGAIPAYLLARSVTDRAWLSLVFPLAYLLHPSLQNAMLDDFHAVTMAAAFLLWAIYFAHRLSMAWFGVFAVLAAATKEEAGLLVAMLGVYLLYRRKGVAATITFFGGIAWFLIAVLIIIPGHNPSGHSPYLSRYSYLGHGLAGIVAAPFRHPHLVLRVLSSHSRLEYLSNLLHSLGFTSLLGLPMLLLSWPVLLINMLSADARMYSGFYQYSAEIVPLVIAASALGIGVVAKLAGKRSPRAARWTATLLSAIVLIFSGLDAWNDGFMPGARGYIVPSVGAHQRLERNLLATIPGNAVIAAADEIEPHLSDRYWAYLLPTVHPSNGPEAQYIALDASIPALPVEPHTLHAVATHALSHGFGIAAARDGVLILRRGSTRHRLPTAFYSFVFDSNAHVTPGGERWGRLSLTGLVVHPKNNLVNRSRPAVAVDTYWQTRARLPSGTRIVFYLSPVYSGAAPRFRQDWFSQSDTPTLDWLPAPAWPVHTQIHVASLPLIPPPGVSGKVDVAVGVYGLSPARGSRTRIAGRVVRLGTIAVHG